MRGSCTTRAWLSVDVLLVDAAGGAAAALQTVDPIVTVATATAQANRIRCCLAVIRSSPETETRSITLTHFAQRRCLGPVEEFAAGVLTGLTHMSADGPKADLICGVADVGLTG
jgi:hypothetical protein